MTCLSEGSSVVRLLEIKNRLGLHARAAAKLVQTATRYEASITISGHEQVVDGKSILSVMTLAAGKGDKIEVRAVGQDAAEAVAAIENLVECLFHDGV